jgi:hypothetical protein
LLIILLLTLTACGSATTTIAVSTPKTSQALQPITVSTALFQTVKPDGIKVSATMDDLKKLPPAQVPAEGKMEEGPRLNFILLVQFRALPLTINIFLPA